MSITQNDIASWFSSDEQFQKLYPIAIQAQSARHWTPLQVVRKASYFLSTQSNIKILDIGSGVGKFCLAAAFFNPNANFFGVEQRKIHTGYSNLVKEKLKLGNVKFIHCNFTQIDFKEFDHFYFFNSFFENLEGAHKIDDSISYSSELYHYYNRYLFNQLLKKPVGTRIVTFHSQEDEIPPEYLVVNSEMDNHLKFWVKI
jgi:SAM-dependent methyltransferase